MPTRWRGHAEIRRRAGTGSHTVVLADDDQVRAGTTSWVEHELRSGSKVLYKGWLDVDLEAHPMFLDPAHQPMVTNNDGFVSDDTDL